MPTNYSGFSRTSMNKYFKPSKENPLLIALTGKLASGKSHAALYLCTKYDGIKVAFADALKLEVYEALLDDLPPEARDMDRSAYLDLVKAIGAAPKPRLCLPEADEKIAWINANKLSLRSVLQIWGTEFRRAANQNYWIDQVAIKVKDLLHSGEVCIVVDDMRFRNEAAALKTIGFTTIKLLVHDLLRDKRSVNRDGAAIPKESHQSETELDSMKTDYIISNEEYENDLYHQLETAILYILNKV